MGPKVAFICKYFSVTEITAGNCPIMKSGSEIQGDKKIISRKNTLYIFLARQEMALAAALT